MALTGSAETIYSIRQYLHSLAQPLAVLTGTIDLLLLEMDEADPRLPEFLQINEQLEKILQIIGEIRRLARGATRTEAVRHDSVVHPEL